MKNINISTIVFKSFSLLGRKQKRKLLLVTIFQILLSLIDLIAVGLIGVVGAISLNAYKSNMPGNRVKSILNLLRLNNLQVSQQIIFIGVSAVTLMIVKTLISMIITNATLHFLARQSAEFSIDLSRRVISREFRASNSKSIQELIYYINTGSNSLITGILGPVVTILSDLFLITIMIIGISFVDIGVAIGGLIFFSLIALILHKVLSTKAMMLSSEVNNLNIRINEIISGTFKVFRELYVQNLLSKYLKNFAISRQKISEFNAKIAFLPYVSKYLIESSVIIGTFLLTTYQFIFIDPARAVGNLAIYLAAGSRIAPAVLRLQQSSLLMRSNIGSALPTLKIFDNSEPFILESEKSSSIDDSTFTPIITFENVSFRYPGNSENTINNLNFQISPGQLVAIVGKSGAGKSTIADLIIGLIEPSDGEIKISGVKPSQAINLWPGAISYVPQEVSLIEGTLASNVILDPSLDVMEQKASILEAIKKSNLEQIVQDSDMGVDKIYGEKGTLLSGGQRQRLGIARALFTKPKLILMDEATSALDAETEFEINNLLSELEDKVTIIIIAHRLATVRKADVVFYVDGGELIEIGTFEEVRSKVKDFDRQAKLLGL